MQGCPSQRTPLLLPPNLKSYHLFGVLKKHTFRFCHTEQHADPPPPSPVPSPEVTDCFAPKLTEYSEMYAKKNQVFF